MSPTTTERTHAPDGTLTISEMKRQERAWADEQPEVASCGRTDCHEPGWTFEGTAAEARAAFAEHANGHPRRAKAKRETDRQRAEREAAARREIAASRAALDAMDAGEPQPPPEPPAPAEPQPPVEPQTAAAKKRIGSPAYGRTLEERADRVIAEIQARARELGHPPTSSSDAALAQRARITHGSWANAVEAAGFERPSKGTRHERPRQAPPPPQPKPAEPTPPRPGVEALADLPLMIQTALFGDALRNTRRLGHELANMLERAGQDDRADSVRSQVARLGGLD